MGKNLYEREAIDIMHTFKDERLGTVELCVRTEIEPRVAEYVDEEGETVLASGPNLLFINIQNILNSLGRMMTSEEEEEIAKAAYAAGGAEYNKPGHEVGDI